MTRTCPMAGPKWSAPRRAALIAFYVFTGALSSFGWQPSAGEPDAGSQQQEHRNYARTPDAVIPYRDFREPYARFFQKVMAFRGYGREVEAGGAPETVRIGVLAPSGSAPDADLGREMRDGITLAVESTNSAGGYRGIPFEIVLRSDAGLWGSSANEMVTLKYVEDVLAVIGSIDGANTHVALRAALKLQVPMVNTATTDPTLTETNIPWIIRCMADDRQQGYALAHHIFNERGIGKVAALRVNDRYGRTGIAEFRDAARRLRRPLRIELRWNRGGRDFSEQLDRIAQTGAEAVVLWGNASDAAAVVREMRRRRMSQLVFGCDRLVSEPFLAEAGDAAEGVVAVATFNPTISNPRYTEFAEAFQDRFNRKPGTFAAHAYDGTNILIESIRKAGPNRVRLRDALYEHRGYDGVTGRIEFDTTLNDIGPVYIATVRGGAYRYQRAAFTETARAARDTLPYRTLLDSPPTARVAEGSGRNPKRNGFRIGCFLPLDPLGQSAVRGLRMALLEEASAHPDAPAVELVVRDSRGVWGDDSGALATLFTDAGVLAIVGSTERRATHLMETLAAKLHLPVITLCGDDPTIHAIPLSWVFSVAPAEDVVDNEFARHFELQFGSQATTEAAMGYDAGQLLIGAIRGSDATRAGDATRSDLEQTQFSRVAGPLSFPPSQGGTKGGFHQGVSRATVRKRLAAAYCDRCASGSFHFDALGRRVDGGDATTAAVLQDRNTVIVTIPQNGGGEEDR